MSARYCTECANLVTTAFCPNCGALQPGMDNDQSTVSSAGSAQDPPTEPQGGQPWHPFEQPSWGQEPERSPQGVPLLPETPYGQAPPPPPGPSLAAPQQFGPGASGTGEFMGVGQWQPAAQPASGQRSNRANWVLGALAAAAVVAVLVAIAFIIIKNNSGEDIATPDNNKPPITVDATPSSTGAPPSTTQPTTASSAAATASSEVGSRSAQEPAATVTVTSEQPSSADASTPTTVAEPESSAPVIPVENPRGGPDREITCNTGYVVQIASAVSDADFQARVAQLRAAGQLPADVAVATTAGSCQIFTTQTNTVVLYAGPFPDKYAACAARLAGAPDSFIKGTTPETAAEYVSCLCPAAIDSLPAITAMDQTGVWVGELQRVLANKLKYKIPDLNGLWGTYSPSTFEAVKSFQTDQGLPVTGQVDAATWQKLQAAQC